MRVNVKLNPPELCISIEAFLASLVPLKILQETFIPLVVMFAVLSMHLCLSGPVSVPTQDHFDRKELAKN